MASAFDIRINAKADTSSAAKAVDELNKSLGITRERERELADMRKSFLTAAEAEVELVKQLTQESLKLAKAKEEESRRKPVFSTEQLAKEREEMAKAAQEAKKLAEARTRLEEAAKRTAQFFSPQPINPWVTASRSAVQVTEQLGDAQGKTAFRAANMGQAMLQGSRAIQDLQFGVAGVLNNIEGLAAAMGAGAGVAGAATIAAVALTALGPQLMNVLNALIPLDEALGKVSQKLGQDALDASAKYEQAMDKSGQQSRAFETALQGEKAALDAVNDSIDRQVKLLETRQRIQLMMEDAGLAAQVQDIKALGLDPAAEARAIAEARLGSQDRKAAIEEQGRQQAMQAAQAQYGNLSMSAATAQQRFDQAQRQTQRGALFELNQAEIAKLEQQIRERGMAGELTPQELADRDARDAAARAEITRRTQSNQGILSEYGGQQPRQFSREQIDALRADAEARRAAMQGSAEGVANLSTAQQAAREMAAAQRMLSTQGIAREFTGSQFGGMPLFNNAATGAATGLPFVTPMLPGQVGPLNRAGFNNNPLVNDVQGLGAPLGRVPAGGFTPQPAGSPLAAGLAQPLAEATQAVQNSPLNDATAGLGAALKDFGSTVVQQQQTLTQQMQQVTQEVRDLRGQMTSAR